MIRYGDRSARTQRMVERMAEIEAAEKVRPEQGQDPLGFGLTYPVMAMSYDVERDTQTPLSGLIYEDDPNLMVVSLVAEAIAEEANQWPQAECGRVDVHRSHTGCTGSLDEAPVEIVYFMEVWS